VDVVVRPLDGAKSVKLLVSDAQTDAPLECQVEVDRYGATGQAVHAKSAVGRYPGHYLVDLPSAGSGRQSLVVRVAVEGRDPEILAVDGIGAAPVPLQATKPLPDLTVLGLTALALVVLVRNRKAALAGVLAIAVCAGGDARAHGPAGDVAPEPPGSQLYLSQEIQFALGLRTAVVDLRTFEAPNSTQAARQYPAVPRSAVVERYGKKLLIVKLAPEHFVAREVTLGWAEASFIAVERGVNPGERVLVDGAAFLRNGGALAP
jgi:hypothetical protein